MKGVHNTGHSWPAGRCWGLFIPSGESALKARLLGETRASDNQTGDKCTNRPGFVWLTTRDHPPSSSHRILLTVKDILEG